MTWTVFSLIIEPWRPRLYLSHGVFTTGFNLVSRRIKLNHESGGNAYVLRHVDRPYASATSYVENPQLRILLSRGNQGCAVQFFSACKEDDMV